jgi:cellulose synthase/poly-beta-1,6-N-acetylglucosamine synthase-like glycosyltransferase
MANILFLLSLLLIIYAYIGYPVSLFIISLFKRYEVNKSTYYPCITIVIAAYNEEKIIVNKIENTLSLRYPKDKLQIIIASDGSTDNTNQIVASYRDKGIEFLAIPQRGGKESAQKEAIRSARGEVLVFTDVATMLDPNGVEQIVSNFSDPCIGCVSSEDKVIGMDGRPSGEGIYVRYEMWLRGLESRVNSLVGLSGSFFAARRTVCQDFSGDLDSDFRVLLASVKKGLRGVSDPASIGYYRDISDPTLEFERKVRTVLRGLTVFFKNTEFLNIFKYGMFSYQYFCHKLLRWLVPVFLIIVFISLAILSVKSWIYFSIFTIQLFIIFMIFIERYFIAVSIPKIFYIPKYFLIVNASILVAWYRYFRHERVVIWNPTVR